MLNNDANKTELPHGFGEKFQELYFGAIDEVQRTEEYKRDRERINRLISRIVDRYSMEDTALIDELVSLVMEGTTTEYDFANDRIVSYFENYMQNGSKVECSEMLP